MHNTDANRWSLESGTNNTTQIPRRTDEFGCPTTALNQQGAESVKDAVYDAAGFNLNDKAADQASTNEITQLQEGDYDCQVRSSIFTVEF